MIECIMATRTRLFWQMNFVLKTLNPSFTPCMRQAVSATAARILNLDKTIQEILKKITAPVILVDDIVTTGTTILEARDTLQKAGVDVLFALVLADAKF